ncbi:unnamed protein product [Dracunculus medinensis]|uniref:Lethal protein 858 n=1 Tax=Dracunculus medinensis TaxID=318479 RepID=A0A0N4UK55_DRAME|nr:unnamed protein product [Dracunculus medinensis]
MERERKSSDRSNEKENSSHLEKKHRHYHRHKHRDVSKDSEKYEENSKDEKSKDTPKSYSELRKKRKSRNKNDHRPSHRRSSSDQKKEKNAEKIDSSRTEITTDQRKSAKEPVDLLKTRTGGAYIPPAKLKMMQEQITDQNSEQYQRINWERLKKKIHGTVNKANTGNLVAVVRELLQENIIRGKGLLARSIIQAQSFSPTFSNVYAALVAVINSKFPNIGELILRRLIIQFKRTFRRNDKAMVLNIVMFIAHLVNQQVVHEIVALELMLLLLNKPTDDSVEITVTFLKECGAKLTDVSPRAVNAIFDRLRAILTEEGSIDVRVQYMIEVITHVRKDKFRAYPAVIEELDLIDEDEQITHMLSLEETLNPENELNVFNFDPDFQKNEAMYSEIRQEIIGSADENSDEDEEESEDEGNKTTIIDSTEQNLVAFRRTVYLIIQSSLDFQEAAHKLMKLDLKSGQDVELCNMIVDTCAQLRTYERFFGLLAERFCRLRKEFQQAFEQIARDTYNTIHRFDITKLRNMARFVAHLLCTDAISWNVLEEVSLNEEDTTSAGRIYLKTLFQEIVEDMGEVKIMERIRDPNFTFSHCLKYSAFDKIFPRDNPNNTRFSINFFTSIGLGCLTLDLRAHLRKNSHKKVRNSASDSKDSISSSSSSSSSSSNSDSNLSDDSSDESNSSGNSQLNKFLHLVNVCIYNGYFFRNQLPGQFFGWNWKKVLTTR